MVEVFIEKIRQFFDEVEIFMLEQIMFFQLVEAQIFLISEYSHMVIQLLLNQILRNLINDKELLFDG
jgi:hypothetical protein